MKKIAKLSLVAAIAVSGFTSANATSLEEAIKGVDISGTAVYRYDDRSNGDNVLTDYVKKADGTSSGVANNDYTNNSYKVAINLKSSINDDLTFNTRTIIGSKTDMVDLNTDSSDNEASFALSHANFAYTGIMNTTVVAGKQAVPSPFAIQADAADNESTGTGLVALVNVGPATVAAAYFNQTNLVSAGEDLAAIGVLGNVGPVALDGWYLDLAETSAQNDGHAAYSLGAKASVEMVKLMARYSAVSHDATGADTEKLWKVGADAKFGIVSAGLAYGQTNDANAVGVGLGDADADTSFQAWGLNLEKQADASLLIAKLGVDVLANVNLSATYATRDNKVDTTDEEYYGQATYKMGKNFMTYARFGIVDLEKNDDESTRGRLHVQYTF